MIYLCYAIMIIVPYLLCGINTAIIVTKIKTGEDIRTLGSGNAGLTNTLRTQGKIAALFVLLGDVLKGTLSILIVRFSFLWLTGTDTANPDNMMTYVGGGCGYNRTRFPDIFRLQGRKRHTGFCGCAYDGRVDTCLHTARNIHHSRCADTICFAWVVHSGGMLSCDDTCIQPDNRRSLRMDKCDIIGAYLCADTVYAQGKPCKT